MMLKRIRRIATYPTKEIRWRIERNSVSAAEEFGAFTRFRRMPVATEVTARRGIITAAGWGALRVTK
jgi:hypothetical protein